MGQNACKPTPLGVVWVPTGPVLPPTWSCMGTNRANTATHLELYGYQPGQYCPPTWNCVGTNQIYTSTHLELCGYQPDLCCHPLGTVWVPTGPVLQSAQSESSLEAIGPTWGPWDPRQRVRVLHFRKLPRGPYSTDLPKSLLV
jgi:hypothetical protein